MLVDLNQRLLARTIVIEAKRFDQLFGRNVLLNRLLKLCVKSKYKPKENQLAKRVMREGSKADCMSEHLPFPFAQLFQIECLRICSLSWSLLLAARIQ